MWEKGRVIWKSQALDEPLPLSIDMLHSEVPVFSAFYFGSSCSSSSGKHSISVDKNVQHNNRRWSCCGHLSWSLPTILHCPVGADDWPYLALPKRSLILDSWPNDCSSTLIIIRCYSCCFYLPTVHYSYTDICWKQCATCCSLYGSMGLTIN